MKRIRRVWSRTISNQEVLLKYEVFVDSLTLFTEGYSWIYMFKFDMDFR